VSAVTGRRPSFPGVRTEDACGWGLGCTVLNVQTGGGELENFAALRLQGTARSSLWSSQTGGKVQLGKLRKEDDGKVNCWDYAAEGRR